MFLFLDVGAGLSWKKMGSDDEAGEKSAAVTPQRLSPDHEGDDYDRKGKRHERSVSESSFYDEEDEEAHKLELGPQFTLKEQLEKDKVLSSLQLFH